MKKLLLFIAMIFIASSAFSQSKLSRDIMEAKDIMKINGYSIEGISNDSILTVADSLVLVTQYAVKKYVDTSISDSEFIPDGTTITPSGGAVDTSLISTKTDVSNTVNTIESLQKDSYFDFTDANNAIQFSKLSPNDNLSIQRLNNNYQLQSFPLSSADSIVTIPVLNQDWENLFSYSGQFGTESGTDWNDLGTLYTIIENDTRHPVGVGGSRAFVLSSTLNQIAYFSNEFKDDIYQVDSLYTVSFWAKQGDRAQDTNVGLEVRFDYSGNPDVSVTPVITQEWQYFNLEFNTLDVSRVFTSVNFRVSGDTGDKINIVDVQMNKGSYSSNKHYVTLGDILEPSDSIFLNYKLTNGGIDYEDFRNIKGGDAASINYLSNICQGIEGCGSVFFSKPLLLTEQVLLREHVAILGNFKGAALAGSSNYLLEGSRIIADLNDVNVSVFKSIGTTQITGTEIGGFVFQAISPAKSIVEITEDLGAFVHDIHTPTNDDMLIYGILFENETTKSLNCVIDNCKISGVEIGIYGYSVNVLIHDTKILEVDNGYHITGGQWSLENCWVEKTDSTGIIFNGDRLNIDGIYAESVPLAGATNQAIFDIEKADFFALQNATLHNQPGAGITVASISRNAR